MILSTILGLSLEIEDHVPVRARGGGFEIKAELPPGGDVRIMRRTGHGLRSKNS
jgi:hypothetical protein